MTSRSGPPSLPHLLVLNAAESLLQLIIARREKEEEGQDEPPQYIMLTAQAWHAPGQGAELLAPALNDALRRLRISAGDIARIACVCGPGSFTGLRLAAASAAGLARATEALQAGIEYLPLLAASALARLGGLADDDKRGLLLWVVTHARRQLVHMQGFMPVREDPAAPDTARRHTLLPFTRIMVCTPQEAAQAVLAGQSARTRAGEEPARALLLGSGLSRNRAAFTEIPGAPEAQDRHGQGGIAACPPHLLPADFDHPTPETLLHLATLQSYSCEDVPPLYVRPSDAEENLERIALALHLDPVQAREKLAELTGGTEPLPPPPRD